MLPRWKRRPAGVRTRSEVCHVLDRLRIRRHGYATLHRVGPDRPDFISAILERARHGTVRVVDDQHGCPTITDDLAAGTLRALTAGTTGILHLTNQGATTWYELARKAVEFDSLNPGTVEPTSSDVFPCPATRPGWSVVASERLEQLNQEPLPPWQHSLPSVVERVLGWT